MNEENDLFEVPQQEEKEKKSKIDEIEEKISQDIGEIYSGIRKIPSLDLVTVFLVLGEVILLAYGLLLFLGMAPLS